MTSHPLSRTLLLSGLLAGMMGTASVGAAFAQGWEGHHGFHGGGWALLASANLTDAQKTQVRQVFQAGMAQSKPLREQLHAIDAQIKAKLAAPGAVTMADIAPLLQQKWQIKAQLDQNRMATMLQVRTLLSPSQIAQVAATQAKLEALHAQERAAIRGTAAAE